MISREFINSTRNLIIQNFVFGNNYLKKLVNVNKKSSILVDSKHQRSRSKSTSTSNNNGVSKTNNNNILKKTSTSSSYQPSITNIEKVIKGQTKNFDWEIFGLESQVVQVHLNPGTSITAETGALLEMSSHIEMDTTARGGFLSSFKRLFTGQGLFLTKFVNPTNERARITFSSPYISKILAIKMSEFGGSLICKKNAFLAGENDIEISPKLASKFKTGFLGGQGFILQQLTGEGLVFVHAGGSVIYKHLAENEKIRVSTGNIVAFETTVQYDIEWNKGVKNILFSGEGFALASITGPGTIILQSLPFEKLVQAIANSGILYTTSSSGSSSSSSSPSSSSSEQQK
ncbi:hypothetical protein DLAC_02033 [Tieghemostelium lacteum]|uniref:Uncharacterized protein n=1 Tax=Tieghemostelium lacteum TaxID=361077 RepID=A0A152A5E1_TIELA|nr:hypothetical protein DLAC_02033 [Tieghemostelium lacteum]|eukprot:KYR01311.1 hypothetical protein DLAC_02033 [Tieghemostelium lacteum]